MQGRPETYTNRRRKIIALLGSGLLWVLLSTCLNALADESDLYDFQWLDPDKKVYVLQNKEFSKKGTTYFTLGGGKGFSSKFQNSYHGQLRVGHYLTEEIGFECVYTKFSNSDNDDFRNITAVNNTVPFVRRIDQYYGAMAIWSPFYGKINTFNKIYYFDVNFGLGVANYDTEDNRQSFITQQRNSVFTKSSHVGSLYKVGVRFYIKKNLHLNLNLGGGHYKAPSPRNNTKDRMEFHSDGAMAIGISF